jgi:uncharacterized protein (UPF0332 family)
LKHSYLPNEINDYLDKSEEKLASAELLLQNSKFGDAISRAYYAVFHSIVAVLRLKKVDLKVHKHVYILNQFKTHFIDTTLLSIEILPKLQNMKVSRENADYNIHQVPDRVEAQAILADAKSIITEINEFIHETPGKKNKSK